MTEILGVIGDPIAHSLSPLMHSAAIKKAGIDAIYYAFHVKLVQLPSFIEKVHNDRYLGFNVTIPHKQNIMSYLDEIAPEAQTIGAVNTVLQRKGQLIGYNTDAIGYLRSLSEETKWEPNGKSATLLGAGGAAHAVAYSLLKAGVSQIYIIDEIKNKAIELAENMNNIFAKSQGMDVIEWKDLIQCLPKSDLLVNATPIGMHGTAFDSLPLDALPDNAVVSDLVYTPRETPLLNDAKKLGHKTHEGLGMLLYQGAEAFKIWFGKDPDIDAMRHALLAAI